MKLRDFFILFVALAFGIFASYGLQINSRRHHAEAKWHTVVKSSPEGRPVFCETSFISGFPFVFYSGVNLYIEYPLETDGPTLGGPCNQIPLSKVSWPLFILDVVIVGFLIFLAIALPYFIFSRMLYFSRRRLIFSVLVGIPWALFAGGIVWASGFGMSPLQPIVYYSLGLPVTLGNLVWDMFLFNFGLPVSFGYNFFWVVLPSVIATLLIYLATELFVRRPQRAG